MKTRTLFAGFTARPVGAPGLQSEDPMPHAAESSAPSCGPGSPTRRTADILFRRNAGLPLRHATICAFLATLLAALPLAAQTNTVAIFPEEDPQTAEDYLLVWPTTPGVRYVVQQSGNLTNWTTAPGFPAPAPGPAQAMPFAATGNARFFQVRELDEQPPAIVAQYPQDGAFAVPRFSDITVLLADATGIDTNSIRLTVGELGTFALTNAQLTFSNNLLTFLNGGSVPLGGWSSNVLATLIVADTLGYQLTNTWSFDLELQPQVASNLFVFGSPQAQRAGQQVGNIPTAALARRLGPIPMGAGDPWTLDLVASNRLELSYTNTAPGFTVGQYLCNLTPIRPEDIFNRKITGISDNPANKRLTLFTLEVPLTEMATNGSTAISPNSVILEMGANGAFAKAFEIGATITFPRVGWSLDGMQLKLKDHVSGFDIVNVTTEEFHWWLTPRFQSSLEISWGDLKRFEAIASGNVQAALVWDAAFLLAGVAYEKTLFDLPEAMEPKTWLLLGFVGPVPVFASLGFDVKLKGRAEALATLNFRAGLRQTVDAAFGLTYQKPDVRWVNTFRFPPPEIEPFNASINAEGSLKLSLEPALEFLVYGLAGVSAGITPSGGIVFEKPASQPLSGKLEADVTLDLGVAGPGLEWLNPRPELSLSLWHDEWHLFPDDAAITFTAQPQSQTLPVGGSAYFFGTVTAPQPPAYQWYFNNTPLAGQTARTLLLPSVDHGHAGQYHVRASSGGASLDSLPATLSVQSLVVSPKTLAVPEGGTASFTVRLNAAPSASVTVTTTRTGGDPDLAVAAGATRTFTTANWSVAQSVVLSAAEDADTQNGQATFSVSAAGLPSVSVTATEADNDAPAPSGMALIPAGSFTMGDTFSEGYTDERPTHSVYVSAFYMDKHEVTKALWDEVYNWAITHGYSFDYADSGQGKAANHPAHTMTWYDAVKWCNARSEKEGRVPAYYTDAAQTTVYRTGQVNVQNDWVRWNANGYRLPTEAEWEKAARGGASGRRFPWNDSDLIQHNRANYYSSASYGYDTSSTRGYHPTFNDGATPYTSPVGYFAANGYGLYDMAGNVWEWCWDGYQSNWYSQPGATQNDPRGPTGPLGARVLRGGLWDFNAYYSRCAYREVVNPDNRYVGIGFRCVRGL